MSTQFNASYYLQNNSDVVVAIAQGIFKDAADHYNRFGAKELRNPNAIFDAKYYAAQNADVLNAVSRGVFASVYAHYLAAGATEGRVPNAAFANFDADRYLVDNADVKAAGITTAAAALKHFVEYGVDEGRAAFDKGGSPITINNSGNNTAFTLTNGTDIATANVFTSGLVYTPGGNDRINALQDEDVLTGTGTNATLNATIGNSNDNGGPTITPKLNGIETLNFAFTGSGAAANGRVNTIDLQDATGVKAVNVTRVTDGTNVTVSNMVNVPANLSLSNINSPAGTASFTYTGAGAAGVADSTTVTTTDVSVAKLRIQQNSAADLSVDGALATGGFVAVTEGVETITIASKGSTNTIGTLVAEDLKTLNITGSAKLAINGQSATAGSFSKVDASAFTGDLTFRVSQDTLNAIPDGTSNGDIAFVLTSGTGKDTIILQDTVSKNDAIDGAAGTDTVRFESNGKAAYNVIDTTTTAQVKGFETVQLYRTSTVVDTAFTYNSDQTDGNQSIELKNTTDGAAITTYNLNNLSADEAKAITIFHSGAKAGSANALTQNIINVALKTDGSSDTVQLTIADGLNTDVRFNTNLNAAKVENITLVDSDNGGLAESNTVKLGNVADHTGTITVGTTAGAGLKGTFVNLDATANYYGYDLTGAATDAKFVVDVAAGAAERIVAATFDATAEVGDVVARFGSGKANNGGQSIKTGAGNDTVIFDNLDDNRAGLTISDTVAGGAGDGDTLVIDGNLTLAGELALGASEWTNVSGFETVRVVNPGVGSTYRLTLTNELISANNKNGALAIVNDNDTVNDAANGTNSAGSAAETTLVIDARTLNNSAKFSYNGEEGTTASADRIIFSDVNINGNHTIDGGAANIDTKGTTLSVRNADVIEVRNSAVVSVGDLANIKNVGTLEFTNDLAVTQTSILQLNDEVVDSLVDSFRTSSFDVSGVTNNRETLRVNGIDNSNVSNATTGLTIEAATLNSKSAVSAVLGRGANTVTTGNGADQVVLLGNFTAADAATYVFNGTNGLDLTKLSNAAAGTVTTYRAVTDKINLDGNSTGTSYSDSLVVVGDADLTGATLSSVNFLALDSGSDLKLTVAQFNALARLDAFGVNARTLEITGAGTVDLSKLALASGAGDLNVTLGAGVTSTGTGVDNSTVGNININGSGPVATLAVTPATVAEGSALTYTVTLSAAAATDTTVKYTTGGTATSGADYTAPTGSLVIKAGATTGTVTVTTLNDANASEGTETVSLSLAAGTGYSVGGTATASANITDGPAGSTIVIPTASTGSVAGTAAADTFTFSIPTAQATATDTQVQVTGFSLSADKLQLAIGSNTSVGGPTLNDLKGDLLANGSAIGVQYNSITNETLVTFGLDADGTVIAVTLVGIDATTAQVTLV